MMTPTSSAPSSTAFPARKNRSAGADEDLPGATRSVAGRGEAVRAIAKVFRAHGYEGASLALIGSATGLGKGSLYNFFPGGKAEMAQAVLAETGAWFEREIFGPLAEGGPEAVEAMFSALSAYHRGGGRICLAGAFALDNTRDRFAVALAALFNRWMSALELALGRCGHGRKRARRIAEEIVAGVQGAIVLARATGDASIFERAMDRLKRRALDRAA